MNSLVKVLPSLEKYNDYIFNLKKGVSPIMLSGLTDVAKVHMAYSTKFYTEKPICIVTYNELQAKKIIIQPMTDASRVCPNSRKRDLRNTRR